MTTIPLERVFIHGHEVGYRRAGTGPPLLLIHGMAGSSRTWRDTMPALAENHDVIAPDLLGHGESAKPLGDYSLGAFASGLRDLVHLLGVERITVVGQSLGGGVAMQMAYQYPALVERLVLVGSGGLGREVSGLLRFLTLPGAELFMPVLFPPFIREPGDQVAKGLAQRGWRSPRLAEMWRAYASLSGAPNRKAFLRTLRSVVDLGGQSVSAMDRLYLTHAMPSMIVWGDQDHIIPVEHAYAAHEAMPGSRLEILPDVGHFPHAEAPHQFAALLTDFIATTSPADFDDVVFRELLDAG